MLHPFISRFLITFAAGAIVSAAPAPHYAVTGQISGPDGGWDYATVDPATGHLYVARATNVTVVDFAQKAAVRSIGDIAKGHAVVPIPGNLLLVTSGRDDSVRFLDTGDGHEAARIAVGGNPDAAFYDSASGHAVVMNAKAGTVSIIDVAARKVMRTIALKSGLEYGVLGRAGVLFVNNEDENEVESANLRTGEAGKAIPMPGCEGPTGLAYDPRTDRLISACANGKAAVIDAKARRMVALLVIGNGPDAVILDVQRRLAFIPSGRDGMLTIVSLDANGGPKVTASVKTEIGARTGALDDRTGTIYLPTARFTPAAIPGGRPAAIPGSFHIVIVSRR